MISEQTADGRRDGRRDGGRMEGGMREGGIFQFGGEGEKKMERWRERKVDG